MDHNHICSYSGLHLWQNSQKVSLPQNVEVSLGIKFLLGHLDRDLMKSVSLREDLE